jgi:MFS transporter, DHA3 family, macrolide efflux protein
MPSVRSGRSSSASGCSTGLFLLYGISYLISAGSECFVSIRQSFPEERMTRQNALVRSRNETADGLRGSPRLAGFGRHALPLIPTGIAMPILVRDFYHRGPEFLGIMAPCQALGSLVGFVVAGAISIPPQRRPYLVQGSMIVAALLVLALGFISTPMWVLPVVGLFGFLLPLINVNIISLLQGTTPSEMRGRVMGVLGTLVTGLIPLSQGLSGMLIDAIDQQAPLVYQIVGVLFMSLVLVATVTRNFRTFLATDYAG